MNAQQTLNIYNSRIYQIRQQQTIEHKTRINIMKYFESQEYTSSENTLNNQEEAKRTPKKIQTLYSGLNDETFIKNEQRAADVEQQVSKFSLSEFARVDCPFVFFNHEATENAAPFDINEAQLVTLAWICESERTDQIKNNGTQTDQQQSNGGLMSEPEQVERSHRGGSNSPHKRQINTSGQKNIQHLLARKVSSEESKNINKRSSIINNDQYQPEKNATEDEECLGLDIPIGLQELEVGSRSSSEQISFKKHCLTSVLPIGLTLNPRLCHENSKSGAAIILSRGTFCLMKTLHQQLSQEMRKAVYVNKKFHTGVIMRKNCSKKISSGSLQRHHNRIKQEQIQYQSEDENNSTAIQILLALDKQLLYFFSPNIAEDEQEQFCILDYSFASYERIRGEGSQHQQALQSPIHQSDLGRENPTQQQIVQGKKSDFKQTVLLPQKANNANLRALNTILEVPYDDDQVQQAYSIINQVKSIEDQQENNNEEHKEIEQTIHQIVPSFRFQLTVKSQGNIIIAVETEEELNAWESKISKRVIKSDIEKVYQFLDLLGEGASGKVFLAHRKQTQFLNESIQSSANGNKIQAHNPMSKHTTELMRVRRVAIKIIEKKNLFIQQEGLANLIQEIKVHWCLEECDGILKLLEMYEDQERLFLVLEYQQEGSLLTGLMKNQSLNEMQVKIVMGQLLLTLDFIHKRGIIHRDIKLDNILINKIEEQEYNVKIADFGLATFGGKMGSDGEGQNLLHLKCGTPGYAAPEILRDHGYSFKSDIFSLGSVLFNLLTGCYLFSGATQEELLLKNKECLIDDLLNQIALNMSPLCLDLLRKMLSVEPSNRPSAAQALEHPWFKAESGAITSLLAVNSYLTLKYESTRQKQMIKDKVGQQSSQQIRVQQKPQLTSIQNIQGNQLTLPPYQDQFASFKLANSFFTNKQQVKAKHSGGCGLILQQNGQTIIHQSQSPPRKPSIISNMHSFKITQGQLINSDKTLRKGRLRSRVCRQQTVKVKYFDHIKSARSMSEIDKQFDFLEEKGDQNLQAGEEKIEVEIAQNALIDQNLLAAMSKSHYIDRQLKFFKNNQHLNKLIKCEDEEQLVSLLIEEEQDEIYEKEQKLINLNCYQNEKSSSMISVQIERKCDPNNFCEVSIPYSTSVHDNSAIISSKVLQRHLQQLPESQFPTRSHFWSANVYPNIKPVQQELPLYESVNQLSVGTLRLNLHTVNTTRQIPAVKQLRAKNSPKQWREFR
ncbi:hypothetical protein FGO68_gene1132 [Halteria grandinella]|uniref:Protein kinase domain-containing protein n=1 Tax=Halteria grandinella TaxID=5974 RepID=A0A8J8P4G3_HALGN|nr:hypothetical protein FGO68_gene1132 [Halteria grandinella]